MPDNCVNEKVKHIYFLNDSLVFEFAKSKGHQKGELHVGPWHVYSNPQKPWLCPVLSLARFLFCYPDILQGDVPLFEGESQYRRYCNTFLNLVEGELSPELKRLGYEAGNLGTHSSRKGVATMVACGCTVSPPISSLCIRAGWIMGGVKDKYIKRENAGDQYVGRCASNLDQLVKEFATSPCYFDYSGLSPHERLERKKKVMDFMIERLPNAKNIPAKTMFLAEMAFAAICYHREFLTEKLAPECIFRASPMFCDIPSEILSLVVVKFPWDKTADTPKFTGIPPHVMMLAEMEKLNMKMQDLHTGIVDDLEKAMDERGFCTQEYNTQCIIKAMEEQSKKLVADVLATTTTVTRNISEETRNQRNYLNFVEEDNYELDEIAETLEEKEVKRQKEHEISIANVKKRKFTVGFHHGVLNPLPADFKFPIQTFQQLVVN